MKELKKEIYGKYEIVTYYYSQRGTFSVMVNNLNAKKAWNMTVSHYSMSTIVKAQDWIENFKKGVDAHETRKAEWKTERLAKRKTEGTLTGVVKKALAEKYGFKNVRVVNGRGTAYGWANASVTLNEERPRCEMCPTETWRDLCYQCREKINKAHEEAEMIAYKAVKAANMSFGHYYSDDGYGIARSEFILDINYQK
jgi:hypothetical protein